MRVARVQAQAKINLFLRVGAPDATGYHPIATLFLRLDLADEIVIRAGGSVRTLDASGPRMPAAGLGSADENLAFRAAVAYAERARWPRGFSIELTKNIPVGGGLGGGSSDAGAVLRALDALSERPFGTEVLQEIGGSLGSDVPFLASEHAAALGAGRGETLLPVGPLPDRNVLLIVPDFAISTSDAYRWLDHSRPSFVQPEEPEQWLLGVGAMSRWDVHEHALQTPQSGRTGNDFEVVVEQRHPELRELRQRLSTAGARIARLSGSGSTVFGIFDGAAPEPRDLALDALVIPTRTSSRVVQVEVLE